MDLFFGILNSLAYRYRTPFRKNLFCRMGFHVLRQIVIPGEGYYFECICCGLEKLEKL